MVNKATSSLSKSLSTNKKILNLSTKIKSKFWYWQYQTLVRTLPSTGSQATKHWYGYKAFVHTLQSICTHSTRHLYTQYKASVHTVQSICTHRQDTFLCMKLKQ